MSGGRCENDGFYFGASQFLDVRIKRNQCEADHNPNHEPADILRDARFRVHLETIDVDLLRANAGQGNCNAAIASITRWLNRV